MGKKIFLILVFMLFVVPCFAQQNESITITTYYPSPFGVYKNLRIFHSDEAPPACDAAHAGSNSGLLYFSGNYTSPDGLIQPNKMYFCNNEGSDIGWTWNEVGGFWTPVIQNGVYAGHIRNTNPGVVNIDPRLNVESYLEADQVISAGMQVVSHWGSGFPLNKTGLVSLFPGADPDHNYGGVLGSTSPALSLKGSTISGINHAVPAIFFAVNSDPLHGLPSSPQDRSNYDASIFYSEGTSGAQQPGTLTLRASKITMEERDLDGAEINQETVVTIDAEEKHVQINGDLRVGKTNQACDSSHAGLIKFDGGRFQGCTGVDWTNLD